MDAPLQQGDIIMVEWPELGLEPIEADVFSIEDNKVTIVYCDRQFRERMASIPYEAILPSHHR